jgi:VCBS repeat-containing protein
VTDVNAGTLTDTAANDSFLNLTGTLHGHDIDNGEAATLHYAALNADSQPVTTVAGLYGSLTVNTDGTYTFVADVHAVNALQAGSYTDTFTVQTTDAHGATGTATLTVDVTGANDAPVAMPVTLTAGTEDTTYTISASALLAGVTDVDSSPLSITTVGIATGGGTIADNPDGTWSYTPALNYNGPVSFNYTASDGSLTSSSTADLTLTAVNDAPVATASETHYSATAQSDLALQNTGLAVSDVDGGNGIETATLSVGEGIITVGAGDSGITNISGNGTGSVSFSGTVAEIDALLGNGSGTVVYNDNAGTPSASTTLTLTVHDNGNTGGGGDLSASAGSTIDVTSAGAPTVSITVLTPAGVDFHSDAPLREMGAGTIQSVQSSTTFTIVDSQDNVSFVVDGSNFTYSYGDDGTSIAGGILTSFHEFTADGQTALADFTGLSVDAVTWMNDVKLAAHGHTSAIDALTSSFAYTFTGGPGNDAFGSAGHADALVGGAGNDRLDPGGAPSGSHDTVTGGLGSDTFVYQAGYGAVTITDFDQGNSGHFDVSEHDKLEINGFSGSPNISPDGHGNTTVDFGNGDVLTLLGVADASQIPQSDIGGNGNNNGNNSGAPAINNANNTVTYAGTPVFLDPSVSVTDATGTVISVNAWISSGAQSGDTLSIGGSLDGVLTNLDNSTIHYHFDGNAISLTETSGIVTLADFDAALQLIQFSPGAADGARTVTWAAHEAVNTSPTVTTTIDVGPILNGFALTVRQGGTTLLSNSDFNVSDPGFANVTYTVNDVTGGHFEVNHHGWHSAPTGGFTTAQIAAGDVRFVQDGTATVPDFLIHVSDVHNASPDISANVSLEITGANSETITFAGSTGALQLDHPQGFTGKIAGIVGSGDVLDMHGFAAGTTTAATGNGSYNAVTNTTTLTVTDSSSHLTETFKLAGDLSASTWNVSDDHHGGVNIVDPPASSGSSTVVDNPLPPASQTIVASVPNETLTGAGASNTYVFNFAGIGHDTVTDFHPGTDALQFGGGLLPNAQAALNATQDDGHGNTVVTLDAGDAIILSGVLKAQLHAADFHFV